MIISRSPCRISLGGGGTDLPSYYETYEGMLIAGAINKYIFLGAYKQFYESIKLKYSKMEDVIDVDNIQHPLFREALKLVGIKKGVEITSLADVPAGSGLGASGAFLISLLNTLHVFKENKEPTKRQLAEEACKIELEILKEHEGKQDKYAGSFGGLKQYRFHRDGKVSVIPLANEDIIASELEQRISIFYIGDIRKVTASEALKYQDEKTKAEDGEIIESLHRIRDIGIATKESLESGAFDAFGEYLNEHWQIKKKISPSKNKFIEKYYNHALKYGATGGKVMGASTDAGFFMFYHPGTIKEKWSFDEAMQEVGLQKMEFKFDKEGVQTIFNGGGNNEYS
jgi:D-glycero-alpha-D-manno-heptose-7-phosphate kinase